MPKFARDNARRVGLRDFLLIWLSVVILSSLINEALDTFAASIVGIFRSILVASIMVPFLLLLIIPRIKQFNQTE